jgi:hypothetical protein
VGVDAGACAARRLALEAKAPALMRYMIGLCLLAAACTARPAQVSNSVRGAYETALAPFRDGFAVAWYDTRDGNGEIYLRLLDASGRPAGPERRLTNGPENSYEASIDRVGDAIAVAWYDQSGEGPQTAKLGVWTGDGTNLWVQSLGDGSRNPVIVSDGTAILCAWIRAEANGRESVVAGWWDAGGRPRGTPVPLGAASKTTWNLNAALAGHGAAWVVFDAEVTTRASEVYAGVLDGSHVTLKSLTKDDGAPSKYPSLAIAADGRAALSWQDERDGNVEVYLLTGQLRDLAGEAEGRAHRVTTTPGESIGAYLTWNGDRLGLAWSDKTTGQHEVYFTSFDSSGTSREPPQRITQNSTWSLVPAIRPSREGFSLAWTEYTPASLEIHQGTAEVFFTSVP